jgi:hypothetical protein
MASVFNDAVQQEINDQPGWLRYKGSILIVASGLVWVISELAKSPDLAEFGWSGTLGIIATVAAFFINRFTRDGIAPSAAKKLEQAGQRAWLDRPSVSGVVAPELPVYDQVTTNDDGDVGYIGDHRAG